MKSSEVDDNGITVLLAVGPPRSFIPAIANLSDRQVSDFSVRAMKTEQRWRDGFHFKFLKLETGPIRQLAVLGPGKNELDCLLF